MNPWRDNFCQLVPTCQRRPRKYSPHVRAHEFQIVATACGTTSGLASSGASATSLSRAPSFMTRTWFQCVGQCVFGLQRKQEWCGSTQVAWGRCSKGEADDRRIVSRRRIRYPSFLHPRRHCQLRRSAAEAGIFAAQLPPLVSFVSRPQTTIFVIDIGSGSNRL